MLCRKNDEHNLENKSKVFNRDTAVRFRKSALEELRNSAQHRGAIQREMKRVSVFHKENTEKNFGFKILGQTFNNGEKEEEQDATKRTSLRIRNPESETGKRETMRRNSKKNLEQRLLKRGDKNAN